MTYLINNIDLDFSIVFISIVDRLIRNYFSAFTKIC